MVPFFFVGVGVPSEARRLWAEEVDSAFWNSVGSHCNLYEAIFESLSVTNDTRPHDHSFPQPLPTLPRLITKSTKSRRNARLISLQTSVVEKPASERVPRTRSYFRPTTPKQST